MKLLYLGAKLQIMRIQQTGVSSLSSWSNNLYILLNNYRYYNRTKDMHVNDN